jgi:hypothetical protein
MHVMNNQERRAGNVVELHQEQRPRTRSDCADGPRPCPWVGCRYHLYSDVKWSGTLVVYHDIDPLELPETCTLDVSGRQQHTLDEVAAVMGVTRERVHQIEEKALAKLELAGVPAFEEMRA